MNKLVRSLGVMSAAVAFGAGATLLAPVAGAQSEILSGALGSTGSDNCGTEVVTPKNQDAAGWGSPDDENTAKIAAVEGAPESVGEAALTFDTDASGTSLYKFGNKVKLSELLLDDKGDLVPISYEYHSNGQAPALQIRLNDASLHADDADEDGYEDGFATIVWSPSRSDGTWRKATPANTDQYWVSRTLKDADGNPIARGKRMTLKEIIALNPNAVVTDYGIQKTRDNASEGAAIDNFQLGCVTTNFELRTKEESGGIFGSLFDLFSWGSAPHRLDHN